MSASVTEYTLQVTKLYFLLCLPEFINGGYAPFTSGLPADTPNHQRLLPYKSKP